MLCDVHLMESVLKSLLYNAVRHAEREVAATFRLCVSGYELRVEGDGPGTPASDRERMFDSFVQLERDTDKKRKSYGLGPAIVKRTWNGITAECRSFHRYRLALAFASLAESGGSAHASRA